MKTINDLVHETKLSRYYVTKAIKSLGYEIKRGRTPVQYDVAQLKKIKLLLKKLTFAKTLAVC